jgi:hypothetical protein
MIRSFLLPRALLGLLLAGTASLAQDTTDSEDAHPSRYRMTTRTRYSDYVGFGAGMNNGVGISWRHWFPGGWGVQANVLPYYLEETYPSTRGKDYYPSRDSGFQKEGFLSLGLIGLKELASSDFVRAYGYLGGSLSLESNEYDYYEQNMNYGIDTKGVPAYLPVTAHQVGSDMSKEVTLGAGVGAEFFIWRFSLTGMLGYRGVYNLTSKEKLLSPSVDVGAHFRF